MIAIAHPPVCYIYATTLQWRRLTYDSGWILISVEYTTHVMLTLDEQRVRLFVLMHIRISMCCFLVTMIAIAHLSDVYMQPHSHGDGSRLWINIDFGGIYDTLLR